MAHITKDTRKEKRFRGGEMPGVKKFERTGENTFVIHTDSKDKFEGKFNPATHVIHNGKLIPR